MIISKTRNDIQELATLLSINIQGDGAEMFEYNLPTPNNYYRYKEESYTIEYILNGVFWTKQAAEFYNDVLLRFNQSMKINKIKTKIIKSKKDKHELKDFMNLKSLSKTIFIPRTNKNEDEVFWALKLFVEHYIMKENFIAYSTLENYAITHYYDHTKDFSTLRAKCRSIWNWYEAREWKPTRKERKFTDKELKMTRVEHMKQVHKDRTEKTRKKIVNTITGLFADEYKKKNGKWNLSKIAKDLNINRDTIAKYITEYIEEEQNDK